MSPEYDPGEAGFPIQGRAITFMLKTFEHRFSMEAAELRSQIHTHMHTLCIHTYTHTNTNAHTTALAKTNFFSDIISRNFLSKAPKDRQG